MTIIKSITLIICLFVLSVNQTNGAVIKPKFSYKQLENTVRTTYYEIYCVVYKLKKEVLPSDQDEDPCKRLTESVTQLPVKLEISKKLKIIQERKNPIPHKTDKNVEKTKHPVQSVEMPLRNLENVESVFATNETDHKKMTQAENNVTINGEESENGTTSTMPDFPSKSNVSKEPVGNSGTLVTLIEATTNTIIKTRMNFEESVQKPQQNETQITTTEEPVNNSEPLKNLEEYTTNLSSEASINLEQSTQKPQDPKPEESIEKPENYQLDQQPSTTITQTPQSKESVETRIEPASSTINTVEKNEQTITTEEPVKNSEPLQNLEESTTNLSSEASINLEQSTQKPQDPKPEESIEKPENYQLDQQPSTTITQTPQSKEGVETRIEPASSTINTVEQNETQTTTTEDPVKNSEPLQNLEESTTNLSSEASINLEQSTQKPQDPKPEESIEKPENYQLDQQPSTTITQTPQSKESVETRIEPASSTINTTSEQNETQTTTTEEPVKNSEPLQNLEESTTNLSNEANANLKQSTQKPQEFVQKPEESVKKPDNNQMDQQPIATSTETPQSNETVKMPIEPASSTINPVEQNETQLTTTEETLRIAMPLQNLEDPNTTSDTEASTNLENTMHIPQKSYPKPEEYIKKPDDNQMDQRPITTSTEAPESDETVENPIEPAPSTINIVEQNETQLTTTKETLNNAMPLQNLEDPNTTLDTEASTNLENTMHIPQKSDPKPGEYIKKPDDNQMDRRPITTSTEAPQSNETVENPIEPAPSTINIVGQNETQLTTTEKTLKNAMPLQNLEDPNTTLDIEASTNLENTMHIPQKSDPKPKESIEKPDENQMDHQPNTTSTEALQSNEPVEKPIEPASSTINIVGQNETQLTTTKETLKNAMPLQNLEDPNTTLDTEASTNLENTMHIPQKSDPKPEEYIKKPDDNQMDQRPITTSTEAPESDETVENPIEPAPSTINIVEQNETQLTTTEKTLKNAMPLQNLEDPTTTLGTGASTNLENTMHIPQKSDPKPEEYIKKPDDNQMDQMPITTSTETLQSNEPVEKPIEPASTTINTTEQNKSELTATEEPVTNSEPMQNLKESTTKLSSEVGTSLEQTTQKSDPKPEESIKKSEDKRILISSLLQLLQKLLNQLRL